MKGDENEVQNKTKYYKTAEEEREERDRTYRTKAWKLIMKELKSTTRRAECHEGGLAQKGGAAEKGGWHQTPDPRTAGRAVKGPSGA